MPTYTYECEECGEQFDELVMSVQPITTCKYCGSGSLKRVFSKDPSVRFRGSGFYPTDYGTDKKTGSGKNPGKKKKSAKDVETKS